MQFNNTMQVQHICVYLRSSAVNFRKTHHRVVAKPCIVIWGLGPNCSTYATGGPAGVRHSKS